MSRKDIFHDLVKDALTQDGWIISHDPLYLSTGNLNIQIDLGAEQLIGAEKITKKSQLKLKVSSELQKSQIFMVLWDNIFSTKLPYRKTNQIGYYI